MTAGGVRPGRYGQLRRKLLRATDEDWRRLSPNGAPATASTPFPRSRQPPLMRLYQRHGCCLLSNVRPCLSRPSPGSQPAPSLPAPTAPPTPTPITPIPLTDYGQDAALIALRIPGCAPDAGNIRNGGTAGMVSEATCSVSGHPVTLVTWKDSVSAERRASDRPAGPCYRNRMERDRRRRGRTRRAVGDRQHGGQGPRRLGDEAVLGDDESGPVNSRSLG